MKIKRKKTKVVKLGDIKIGGAYPVSIQSMVNTSLQDARSTLHQIHSLEKKGCEIVRIAMNDEEAILHFLKIKDRINIAVEADIHFHYRLALMAIEAGVDGVRLNPGNISRVSEIQEVVSAAKQRAIPIRVGLNSGSLPKKYSTQKNQTKAIVKAALEYIEILELMKFRDIMVSLKTSDVLTTVQANRLFASVSSYPIHLGITASGLAMAGSIKSSIGLGSLLMDGIGDTMRVSLAADPVEEIKVAKLILSSLGLRSFGPEIIACPTCGRCDIDVIGVAQDLSTYVDSLQQKSGNIPFNTIAVMGCVVNGPGEAKDADCAVFGSKDCGVIMVKGKPQKKVPKSKIVSEMKKIINETI